jgi:hypothetical protein
MQDKSMKDADFLLGIAFDDKYDDDCPRFHIFENEEDLIEFISDMNKDIGEYSVYEMKKICLGKKRILH